MREIKSFPIWRNGQTLNAEFIVLQSNFDNLIDTVIFYYSLKDKELNTIVEGNITMDGIDYHDWDGSNDQAFDYAAKKLGIQLIY